MADRPEALARYERRRVHRVAWVRPFAGGRRLCRVRERVGAKNLAQGKFDRFVISLWVSI